MYLSSWDMEHFTVMLDILNDMTIGKNQNLQLMEDNGKVLEDMSDGYDRYIFQLAGAFLTDRDFQMPHIPIAKEGQHIIQRALEAAEVIETVFNAE